DLLVEWPVVLMGAFEEDYLTIPPEVIRATIRANQKCFVLRSPARGHGEVAAAHLAPHLNPLPVNTERGNLANRFILVANLEAADGGAAIIAGNQRVVRARLADAKYFFETGQKPLPDYADTAEKPLDQRLAKMKALNIVFHEKLGTQYERIL